MPVGNDQNMGGRHWMGIPERGNLVILVNNPGWHLALGDLAENAAGQMSPFTPSAVRLMICVGVIVFHNWEVEVALTRI